MNKILITLVAFSLVILMVILPSCRTENPQPDTPPTGKLSFNFKHNADGSGIVFDSLIYVNEAGNNYLINEIQYFISDVTLHKNDGTSISLNKGEDIHYVDTDLPETQTYTFSDSIPVGSYDKITFTFGINEEKNVSLMFVNPPESFMFWPEKLGGGYHYMKFNGKWLNEQGQLSPFNCHLGIVKFITVSLILFQVLCRITLKFQCNKIHLKLLMAILHKLMLP